MKLELSDKAKEGLRGLFKSDKAWAHRRYYCPCGKICNYFDLFGKCSCGLPIADDPSIVEVEVASLGAQK